MAALRSDPWLSTTRDDKNDRDDDGDDDNNDTGDGQSINCVRK